MISRSQSLTCFECDSRNNPECADPFNRNPAYLRICQRSFCAVNIDQNFKMKLSGKFVQ